MSKERFVAALDGLAGMAAREAQMTLKDRAMRFINAHSSALDEGLALCGAIAKALLDRRITTLERNEIVRKAEALIRALNSAPEEQ